MKKIVLLTCIFLFPFFASADESYDYYNVPVYQQLQHGTLYNSDNADYSFNISDKNPNISEIRGAVGKEYFFASSSSVKIEPYSTSTNDFVTYGFNVKSDNGFSVELAIRNSAGSHFTSHTFGANENDGVEFRGVQVVPFVPNKDYEIYSQLDFLNQKEQIIVNGVRSGWYDMVNYSTDYYVYHVYVGSNNAISEIQKVDFWEYEYGDFSNSCEIVSDFPDELFRSISDFSDNQPYRSAVHFVVDSACSFDSVKLKLRNTSTHTISTRVNLFKLNNAHDELLYSYLQSSADSLVDITTSSTTVAQYNFEETQNLMPDTDYSIEVIPVGLSSLDNGKFLIGSYDGIHYDNTLEKYNEDGTWSHTANKEPMLDLRTFSNNNKPNVEITSPCYTSDFYYDEGCHYAIPETYDSVIHVVGNSNSHQSWINDSYNLTVRLYDSSDNIIDSWEQVVDEPQFEVSFDTYMIVQNTQSKELLQIEVCQAPALQSSYKGVGNCARVFVGWGMTDEELGNLVEDVEVESDVSGQDIYVNECAFESWDDYLNVFKGAKCALLWAFVPSDKSVDSFKKTSDKILNSVPIGYGKRIYEDINFAIQSTSTAYFNRDIEVGKFFGRTGGTTTIDFDNLLKYRGMYASLEKLFSNIVWILFTLVLMVWAIKLRL